MVKRCSWVKLSNPLYVAYHDEEWGRPLHDDQKLFELLCLETYQAGLSWETVLNKRQAFRQAFFQYDIARVAQMTDKQLEALLANAAIIRHRAKLFATRQNAQAVLKVQKEFGSLDHFLWDFVGGHQQVHKVTTIKDIPTKTDLSEHLSKTLKRLGFSFTGPVAMQSFLQAAGLVNDHEETCDFKYHQSS
ncbi:DNA-3-methyladenine glycosylase I [Streptococcus sp. DD12]|uniref:DNA-3-methyladenine glycosylase I n=1 Tax=Streptococcus sp. DD12 TaxID=1777880 RepID=UPI00079ACE73|nr:DNA-3-methyladenine glycosylase I [Streptococcus sp. DD12]KXT76067.1 DNA-3-methyladenine glycosylase [Streptococcus sp. DD12]